MDYRGFVAGTVVYLPVFVRGGLFHLGDGHALQGDGEISGTGIEVSMDVVFTVAVLRDRPITWPRGEDDMFIFSVGNARPLDQAVQHATTEMLRWLNGELGLDWVAAQTLLGLRAAYDVGNFCEPAWEDGCVDRGAVHG
jgi:acetamidase/formamidase